MRKASIVASNSHRELLCKVAWAEPFIAKVNLSPQMKALETIFYHQFLRPMSEDGQDRYDITATVDLYGEIVIQISLNGSPKYPYVLPAFASAAMTPVLTSQPDTLDNVATAFKRLQEAVIPAIQPLATELNYGAAPSGARY